MTKWRPIETAPDGDEWILGWVVNFGYAQQTAPMAWPVQRCGEAWMTYGNEEDGHPDEEFYTIMSSVAVTHWMPLPTPPKGDTT